METFKPLSARDDENFYSFTLYCNFNGMGLVRFPNPLDIQVRRGPCLDGMGYTIGVSPQLNFPYIHCGSKVVQRLFIFALGSPVVGVENYGNRRDGQVKMPRSRTKLWEPVPENKLAKLRKHASRVHFAKIL